MLSPQTQLHKKWYFVHLEIKLRDTQARVLVSEDVAFSLHELVEAEQVDLVVMSAHGYAGKNRWPYGSLTTSFILYGNTSLLAVQDLASEDWTQTQNEMASEEQPGH